MKFPAAFTWRVEALTVASLSLFPLLLFHLKRNKHKKSAAEMTLSNEALCVNFTSLSCCVLKSIIFIVAALLMKTTSAQIHADRRADSIFFLNGRHDTNERIWT